MTGNQLENAAERVRQFESELAEARTRLETNPTETNAGAVNVASLKLEAARAALLKVQAEQDRAATLQKTEAYKAEEKQLQAWIREANSQLDQAAAAAAALSKRLDAIRDLGQKHAKIAARHGQGSFLHTRRFAWAWEVNKQIQAWTRLMKAAEIGNPQPKTVNRAIPFSAKAKMLKERYPDE